MVHAFPTDSTSLSLAEVKLDQKNNTWEIENKRLYFDKSEIIKHDKRFNVILVQHFKTSAK